MTMRRQSRAQGGQAMIELAFTLPIIVGLFAVGLQGGLVLDDQVNLQHYAYEGAQWAVANRATATHDDIVNHIQAQICGTTSGTPNPVPTSTAPARYCREGGLTIVVNKVDHITGMTHRGRDSLFGPLVVDAEAATCQAWDLKVTPVTSAGSPATAAQNTGSATFTVSLVGPSGSGLPTGAGSTPLITLGVDNLPPGLNQGTPYFNPPTITVSGGASTSSTLTIYPGNHTNAQTYTLTIKGADQCGITVGKYAYVTVTGPGTPAIVPMPTFNINGLLPLCIPTGGGTITINGQNFAGATVTVGGVSATVTASSGTQLTITVPPLPAGVQSVVISQGGQTFTAANAVTVGSCAGGGGGGGGAPYGIAIPCTYAGGPGNTSGETEYTIQIKWTETLIIPWVTNNNNIDLSASQKAFCQ